MMTGSPPFTQGNPYYCGDANLNWLNEALGEVDALDPEALQTHLRQAPIREHPLCYYVAGMIHALTFTRWWFGRTGVGQPGGPPLRSDRHPLVTAGQPANGSARFTKE
ncbi:MAG: hypothetical protein H6969_06845 [Gammaproteobacteria bacterium]|nr:hypothetical protein [Gammaproteobacteria bacterium]